MAATLIGSGWSGENILSRINCGGTSLPGHRILAGQMPPDVERVNRGYKKLSSKLQAAMAYKFIYMNLPLISETSLTNKDLANRLSRAVGYEVSLPTFLNQVSMAKRAIKKSEFTN
jgi:hypothetical protein